MAKQPPQGQWRYRTKILLQTFSSHYIKMILRGLLIQPTGGSPGDRRNCRQGLEIVASAISSDHFFTLAEQMCEVLIERIVSQEQRTRLLRQDT